MKYLFKYSYKLKNIKNSRYGMFLLSLPGLGLNLHRSLTTSPRCCCSCCLRCLKPSTTSDASTSSDPRSSWRSPLKRLWWLVNSACSARPGSSSASGRKTGHSRFWEGPESVWRTRVGTGCGALPVLGRLERCRCSLCSSFWALQRFLFAIEVC